MSIITLGYGSTNVVTYGYGGQPANILVSGPLSGGNTISIIDNILSNSNFIDTFTGVALDTTKWSNTSAGGTVSTGSGLSLISTAGTSAQVSTVQTYQNFDVSITYSFDQSISSLHYTNEINIISLTAFIAAGTYATLSQIWNPLQNSYAIKFSVYTNSMLLTSQTAPSKSNNKKLRLVRINGTLEAYAGSNKLFMYSGWSISPVTIELNNSADAGMPILLSAVVTSYTPNLLVVFGAANSYSSFITEHGQRLDVVVPAGILPEIVDISIYSVTSMNILESSYQYVAPNQLTISASGPSININNDSVLRDTSASLKGLRL